MEVSETDHNLVDRENNDQTEGHRGEETAVLSHNFPRGYRFVPSDEELIMYYLITKSQDQIFKPNCIISDITLSDYTPEEIAEKHKPQVEGTWYFFTPKVRKSKNGKIRNRLAGDGFWRLAITKDVYSDDGVKIGTKSLLGFHRLVIPNLKEEKTDWLMHEFSLPDSDRKRKRTTLGEEDMLSLDHGYVLCRMYKKGPSKTKKVQRRRSNKYTGFQFLPHYNYVETAPADSEHLAHDDHDQNSMRLSETPDRIDHGALNVAENPPSATVSGENRDLGGPSSDAMLCAGPPTAAANDDEGLTAFCLNDLDAEDARLMVNSAPTTTTV